MIKNAPLIEQLNILGLHEKEAKIYLLLLELGNQSAGILAKKLSLPKSTVLFICERLCQIGLLTRSYRKNAFIFSASVENLKESFELKFQKQKTTLDKLLPTLSHLKNPFSSQPKVVFYDGIENCRKAYRLLLTSSSEILEFGIHKDLVEKLGGNFMKKFINERTKLNISLRSISNKNDVDIALKKRDKIERREQRFFDPTEGKTFSSMAIFDNKVLLLNLHQDPFGILIENFEVSTSWRTIFSVLWKKL